MYTTYYDTVVNYDRKLFVPLASAANFLNNLTTVSYDRNKISCHVLRITRAEQHSTATADNFVTPVSCKRKFYTTGPETGENDGIK
jgi:hypothetical protein